MGRRTMSTKHDSELLSKKVKSLIVEEDAKDTLVLNKGHPWSVAKLLLLGQWSDLYSTIIDRNFPNSNYRFVDLLAGAGQTKISETHCKNIKGSAFVVETFSQKHPFSKYILVEKDTQKCEALRQRTQSLGDKCEVLQKDTNTVVGDIFSGYPDHNLVFIDNEGFNVEWKSIETIMKAKADIIINYPTSSFERASQDPKSSNKLDNFFGDNQWRYATYDRKYSATLYMDKLKSTYERIKYQIIGKQVPAYVSNIRLGNDTYFYDIILVCKQGPYTHYWDELRNDWNQKNCNCLLDFINDKTSRLDWFDGFGAKIEAIGNKSNKTLEPQKNPNTSLESFFQKQNSNNSVNPKT
jgi:three-Cys-motif partner protein